MAGVSEHEQICKAVKALHFALPVHEPPFRTQSSDSEL
jgi:hypothetical protein